MAKLYFTCTYNCTLLVCAKAGWLESIVDKERQRNSAAHVFTHLVITPRALQIPLYHQVAHYFPETV